jgi:L-threonylcarbamoyladenylate synthase
VWTAADAPDEATLRRAVAALTAGGLLIYPTDTLYALGGRALDARAVRAVRKAKGRRESKPLPLVAADPEQAKALCAAWPPVAAALAAVFWPGPLTLVLPAARAVPDEVTSGTGTVAIRVPALALTRALCSGAGPLVSTSANRSGEAPPLSCEDAVAGVGTSALLALDAGPARSTPSTLVDLTSSEPRLLRVGAVDWNEVLGVFRRMGG